ncbi:MAG: hypothetical protein WAK18_01130 [Nocardioidaceae bacterium]
MTERPQDLDPTLEQRDVERAEQLERADVDPEQESNAPNREVRTERVGPGADPADQPGPLDPGQTEPDLATGTESYERPGRDGNWDADTED